MTTTDKYGRESCDTNTKYKGRIGSHILATVEVGRGVVCSCSVVRCREIVLWCTRLSKSLKWGDWGHGVKTVVLKLLRGGGQYDWPLPWLFTAVKLSYWEIEWKKSVTYLISLFWWDLEWWGWEMLVLGCEWAQRWQNKHPCDSLII